MLNNIVTLKFGLEVTQGHSKWYYSKSWVLFAFCSNYGFFLHEFRDKAQYWLKIVIFFTTLHSMPPLIGSPSNIAILFGRMVELPDGEKTVRITGYV